MAPFYGRDSTASRLQSHYEEAAYFLSLSSQKFLVLILDFLVIWKNGLEKNSGKQPTGIHMLPIS